MTPYPRTDRSPDDVSTRPHRADAGEPHSRQADLVAVHAWTEPLSHSRATETEREKTTSGEHEAPAERLAGWQEKYPGSTTPPVLVRVGSMVGQLLEKIGAWLPSLL